MNATVNVRAIERDCIMELRTWVLQLRCVVPWLKITAIKIEPASWDVLAAQVHLNTAGDSGGPYVYRDGEHAEPLPHFFTEGVMFIREERHATADKRRA